MFNMNLHLAEPFKVTFCMLIVMALSGCNYSETVGPDGSPLGTDYRVPGSKSSPYAVKVYEFCPAPGQFVNEGYDAATMQEACDYALNCFAKFSALSLGAFGGYVVVGFDHSILRTGGYDFGVLSNAYEGNSEPGVVWVMKDDNGDGLPNDTWYELEGSESDAAGTVKDYEVTYYRPAGDNEPVRWTDNLGGSGEVPYMKAFHRQPSYYPAWIPGQEFTLKGTLLECRSYDKAGDGSMWFNPDYGSGYADNHNNTDFDIIDLEGKRVPVNYFKICSNLDYIDFIKVQGGLNAALGRIGELSTEVCGFVDLSLL